MMRPFAQSSVCHTKHLKAPLIWFWWSDNSQRQLFQNNTDRPDGRRFTDTSHTIDRILRKFWEIMHHVLEVTAALSRRLCFNYNKVCSAFRLLCHTSFAVSAACRLELRPRWRSDLWPHRGPCWRDERGARQRLPAWTDAQRGTGEGASGSPSETGNASNYALIYITFYIFCI